MMEGEAAKLGLAGGRSETRTVDSAPADECYVPFTPDSLHDLVSPINQVGTLVGLLLNKHQAALDNGGKEIVAHIQKSTHHLQVLVAGLSRYLHVVALPGPYRRCDGNAVLAAALESIRGMIDTHGALVTHDALPELYCHPDQISIVFASLIENSIKFRGDDQPEVRVSAREKENMWVFAVKDNGRGVPPRHYKRVFGMFTRAHQQPHPGAGVGLAIARRVVESHHGGIWIESEVGRGTTVSFTLPRGEWLMARPTV